MLVPKHFFFFFFFFFGGGGGGWGGCGEKRRISVLFCLKKKQTSRAMYTVYAIQTAKLQCETRECIYISYSH